MEKFQVTEPNTGPLISTYSHIREGGRECFITDLPKIRLLSFSAQKIRDGCEDLGVLGGQRDPQENMWGQLRAPFPSRRDSTRKFLYLNNFYGDMSSQEFPQS